MNKEVDEYISRFPEPTQALLEQVRKAIQEVLSEAEERMSYGIPTYTLPAGNIVHFGAYPAHIGFYPGPPAISAFKDQLAGYKTSKGTVQFALDEPIPYDLIKEMTKTSAEIARSRRK